MKRKKRTALTEIEVAKLILGLKNDLHQAEIRNQELETKYLETLKLAQSLGELLQQAKLLLALKRIPLWLK